MKRLLPLCVLPLYLIAETSHTQWLGSWKLRSVSPTDDPAHVAKESTAVLTEKDGKIRRVETGTHLNGQPFKSDTGWIRWDGNPQEATTPDGSAITYNVQDVDPTHQVVTLQVQGGPTIVIHLALSGGGKTCTQIEDVTLPSGKTQRYTSLWDKQ
jgi:hypothetical protein